jgi:hypothetical protein
VQSDIQRVPEQMGRSVPDAIESEHFTVIFEESCEETKKKKKKRGRVLVFSSRILL